MEDSSNVRDSNVKAPVDSALSSQRKRNRNPQNNNRRNPQNNNNNNTTNNNRSNKRICRFFASGNCDRGDACKFLHENENPKADATNKITKNNNGNKNGNDRKHKINNNNSNADASDRKKNSDRATNKKQKNGNNATESNVKTEEGSSDKTNSSENKSNGGGKVHITETRFADLDDHICIESRRALAEAFKYEFMTTVQAQTLPVILDSQKKVDVLAKAKTGTGKTLGFLIPAVEKLLLSAKEKRNNGSIGCLVISPTRELAYQISKEGETLTSFHKNPKINVLVCVGGTNVNKDRQVLKQGKVNILVATPGRLLDHLQNQDLKLAQKMSTLEVLVLDEADQLLDMGFRPDIERVLNLLKPSKQTRQTLLFSATVPKSVSEIASIALKPAYEFIDTVGEDEEQTHVHVRQEVMVPTSSKEGSGGSGHKQVRAIASILSREIKASTTSNPCKIIVFFTTARMTGFMAELFNSASHATKFPTVLEIHSRKSQAVRQRASERFRSSKTNAILFSSDVSARGMDYPGVTFVLQVGLTERAQYIHRLGRTARAGNEGLGTLLLAPYEHKFMTQKTLSDMPLESVDVPELDSDLNQTIDGALLGVDGNKALKESAKQAYRAWLGYYNGQLKKVGWNKQQLVKEANQWALDVGLREQPSLLKKTVGKMGLKGTPGLRLE